jgi:hypothetical protein
MGEEAYPGRRRGHIGDGQDVEENPVQASTAGEDGSANDGRRYPAQAASAVTDEVGKDVGGSVEATPSPPVPRVLLTAGGKREVGLPVFVAGGKAGRWAAGLRATGMARRRWRRTGEVEERGGRGAAEEVGQREGDAVGIGERSL